MTRTAAERPRSLSRRIRRAAADAPAVVQALAVAAAYFAFLTLIDLGLPEGGRPSVVARAVIAVLAGALAIGSRRLRRRGSLPAPRPVEVSEAVEDAALPPGADPAVWLPALERRRAAIRQEAWSAPVALALMALLVSLAIGGDGWTASDAVLLALLALGTAGAVWSIVSRGRRRDAVDVLLIPLQEAASADEEPRAGWPPPARGGGVPPAAG